MRKNKGITLIALVITIIVLLILAGVSIATLLGNNGILNQAEKAKVETRGATVEEECNLWKVNQEMDSQTAQGTVQTLEGLLDSLEKRKLITAEERATIKETGEITIGSRTINFKTPTTVEEAIRTGHVYQKNEDREIEDAYGNKVVVPEGFKIVEGEDVTKGVVIEDATYENTKGSQFVWIPVGTIYTDEAKTEGNAKTINIGRYDFDSATGEESSYSGGNKEENSEAEDFLNYGNKTAKLEVYNAFTQKVNGKTKVEEVGGYYIGRYEARVERYTEQKTSNSDNELSWTRYIGGKLVEKPEAQVLNCTTQNKASELCRNMYISTTFESDLMNSYAWDTAIVFLQTFDDRNSEAKTIPYSQQTSLNTESDGIANTGTNNINDNTKEDKICNVWDIASNCYERTTETNYNSKDPCVLRGGRYNANYDRAHYRNYSGLPSSGEYASFRPILIV